jgi:hypothetical protein
MSAPWSEGRIAVERDARKQALIDRSAVLRRQLAHDYITLVAPAERVLDRVVGAGHWLRRHPWLLGGVALAWLWWRPRRAVGLGGRLLGAWALWQRWRPMVSTVLALAGSLAAAGAVNRAGGAGNGATPSSHRDSKPGA